MSYQVNITKRAKKAIDGIAEPYRTRIREAIADLAEQPRPHGCRKLSGYEDLWRIRVADYRIVYSIEDGELTIEVVKVGHRREIYD